MGMLAWKELQSRLVSCQREGVVWMELKLTDCTRRLLEFN